ncbi:hypothetical protein [Methanoculleus chikugoensis]|uniref:Uncharacterized protein n=1 Tax=Methanoculleus chikugoensis TaxID=118126 RepID=A0ABM7H4Y0_9EURY|nr:hypothetical protein [Methanoculleus chikugoensis]BBL67856.1 hypothetical protein MchiMG62_10370 [Methanoculleus chikugoensis]
MLFVQAMLTVASHRRVTMSSLAEIRRDVLATGFDLVFAAVFVLSLAVIALAILSRDEVRADNLEEETSRTTVAGAWPPPPYQEERAGISLPRLFSPTRQKTTKA